MPYASQKNLHIIAIFTAYNCSKTLRDFYGRFPLDLVDEIILVDDASTDGTYELAHELGIPAYRNTVNLGYGGNTKRAIELALDAGGDIIIDIHPDGEYDASAIVPALKKINSGAKCVLGRRFDRILDMLQRGMYPWKVFPLIAINFLPRLMLDGSIKDYHQGFRVYTREMLNEIFWRDNSNNFLFSFEIICQALFKSIPIEQVPVITHYHGQKRGATFKHSLFYTVGIMKVLFLYLLGKMGWRSRIFR